MNSPTRVVATVASAMREQASTLRASRRKETRAVRAATPSRCGASRAAAMTAAYRASMITPALVRPRRALKAQAAAMRIIS